MSNIRPFLTNYLNSIHQVYASGRGTDERSYYPALATLFNTVGATLTPRVAAIHDIKDRGVGHPDFLIYDNSNNDSRAAVEAKGTAPELEEIINSEQVSRYLSQHDPTLVTNLRSFALVKLGRNGQPEEIMRHTFAPTEGSFWFSPVNKLVNDHAESFEDFLITAMTWGATITRPVDLAEALARYAREALRRLELQPAEALAPLKKALSDALGLQFTGADGEHFFRSSLVQTLFYGLFSAWVACHRRGNCTDFRWREASDYLGLPLVRELFEQIAIPSRLESLDIRKPIEWAEATLNRTSWDSFSTAFDQDHAVNYFYEPFLQAFDPQLRKDLGVWYTPPEIVRYMVARVDTVLREELGLEDGLASPNVVILDPCCGTGAYLLETLRCIARTLHDKGGDALLAADLKRAAATRVFGFEIMPAPFVVAHLQIGTLLADFGAPLKTKDRAGIFLTNALTGWEKRSVNLAFEGFPELKHEAEAAAEVKQDGQILVILGNPPYSGFAGTAVAEERDLTNAYRTTKRAPAPQGQGLNDLYVRFFRMAERRIVEKTGRGIVCFISNYSWLDGLSFTGMRERYLEVFDKIWVDNLHGDRIISEYAPDGRTSETVFAMRGSSPGIKIGTAISLMVAKGANKNDKTALLYSDFAQAKAEERRAALLENLNHLSYDSITPVIEIGLPFKPRSLGKDFLSWPRLTELFPVSFPGVKTSRDDVVVDIDKERLLKRMQQYFDPAVSHEQMRQIAPGAMEDGAEFPAVAIREQLRKRGFLTANIIRYCYRPFDMRWLYWEPETKLLDRNRAEYFPHVFEGNLWIVSQQKPRRDWSASQVIESIGCLDLMDRGASCFPLYLKQGSALDKSRVEIEPNLTEAAARYLAQVLPSPPTPLPQGEGSQGGRAVDFVPAKLIEAARRLRQDQTSAEAVLWECLRDKQLAGLKFRRQHPVKGTPYIADFYCNEAELIIELDGSVHLTQQKADHARQSDLEQRGYRVLRFTNDQVINNLDTVLNSIHQCVSDTESPSDSPLFAGEGLGVRALFHHTIAIMHSPAYRLENAGALRQDWPRIPLPLTSDVLLESAALGEQIAALLDTEKPVPGISSGKILEELKSIGVIARVGGSMLNPDTELKLMAGWGHAGKGGVTMPGKGKIIVRDMTIDEFAGANDPRPVLGDKTCDVYINDVGYWRNIPLRVWEYTMGGYQVIKKWLSYREYALLGRALTLDEAREVTNIARRIAAILLLEPELDANYAGVKAQTVSLS